MLFFVLASLGALLLPAIQDAEIHELIRKLNSDKIEERESAQEHLLERGESVRPGIEEALRTGQGETSQRAREILKRLDLRVRLGDKLLKAMPGLDRRLCEGTPVAWTEAFLEATEQRNATRRHPELVLSRQRVLEYRCRAVAVFFEIQKDSSLRCDVLLVRR